MNQSRTIQSPHPTRTHRSAILEEGRAVSAGVACLLFAFLLLGPLQAGGTVIPTAERAALVALYNATDGDNWVDNTDWLGAEGTECSWFGVTCSGAPSVTELVLINNGLDGTLPGPELSQLSALQVLRLNGNALTGPIPLRLGDLGELRTLRLSQNALTGRIPPQLNRLTNLNELNLATNQLVDGIPEELGTMTGLSSLNLAANPLGGKIPPALGNLTDLIALGLNACQLTGSIPPEIGNLTSVVNLSLNVNSLTGEIPAELGNLTAVETLRLNSNELEGTIPPELGNLSALRTLWLLSNELTGPIPSELGNLSNLEEMRIDRNQLGGPLPASLGDLANLDHLELDFNEISGPIPASLSQLNNLEILRLGANQLSGTIPPELGDLPKLELLVLSSNQLTGQIPPELGGLSTLRILLLCNNQLTGPIPPELGNLENLEVLHLCLNQLSGPIPPELGNLAMLEELLLNDNQLTGPIPDELLMLQNLDDDDSDFRNNHLYTDNPELRDFLNAKQEDGDWESSQIVTRLYFAQFGNGLGLTSALLFTSSDAESEALLHVRILDDFGALLALELNGQAFGGEGDFVLPPGGRLDLVTSGQGDLVSGSVAVIADRFVDGVVLFAGEGLGFAGVGSSVALPAGFTTPVEISASGLSAASSEETMAASNTGVAIQNLEEESVELTYELVSKEGVVVAVSDGTRAGGGPSVGSVDALGHFALFAGELAWETSDDLAGFVGIFRANSSGRIAATAILTRPGQFATLPVTPLKE